MAGRSASDERAVYERDERRERRARCCGTCARETSSCCTTRRPRAWCGRSLDRGAQVIWRCHVGLDVPNDFARSAWDFLRPYVAGRRGVRLLAQGVRLGGPRSRAAVRDPAVDRRLHAEEPGARRRTTVAAILAARGSRRAAAGGAAGLHAHRRLAGAGRRARRADRGRSAAGSGPARHAGLALGPPQGPRRRARGVRAT